MVKITAHTDTVFQMEFAAIAPQSDAPLSLRASIVSQDLKTSFGVNHGTLNAVDMLHIQFFDAAYTGRGEARLYKAYDENFSRSISLLRDRARGIHFDMTPDELAQLLPAGATRNALDLALLDYRAQRLNQSVTTMINTAHDPKPVRCTDLTISVDTPQKMQTELIDYLKARDNPSRAVRIKIKMGAIPAHMTLDDAVLLETNRLRSIVEKLPEHSECLIDANEGWTHELFERLIPLLNELNILVVEQPLPRGHEAIMSQMDILRGRTFALIADESFHDPDDLHHLLPHFDGFNVKLDKMGGLTTAQKISDDILAQNKKLMVGCMVGSSLAVTPAFWLASRADWADLDGASYLRDDYPNGIRLKNGYAIPSDRTLWGYPRTCDHS